MTQILHTSFTAAVLSAAVLFASSPSFAYGDAVPMSVIGIEAMAPVTSLNATSTEITPVESQAQTPAVLPASRLSRWIAALRQLLDGAIEVALR
ncbi:MAG: hypothetical protein M3O62_14185 [Pseudomonadota bacterium]|nr:hypothetical protein [Pseudomonadota bacterium]